MGVIWPLWRLERAKLPHYDRAIEKNKTVDSIKKKHMPNGRNQQNGSFGQTWNGPPDISNLSINN